MRTKMTLLSKEVAGMSKLKVSIEGHYEMRGKPS